MNSTILETEIHEQPEVVRRLIEQEAARMEQIAQALRGQFNYILIAARGSSDNAARYAQYLLGSANRLQVALATPSLFTTYNSAPRLDGALVMGISQSGRSPDIIAVLEEAHRQGRPTVAITNEAASPLAQTADHVLNLDAGSERAIAATKTYTASLAAIALFSCMLKEDSAALSQLRGLPALMEQTLLGLGPATARVERYLYMDRCVVLGRGFNYATAFEISLKIKELTQTVAEPYSSADFLHGPIAMVQRHFPAIVICPSGRVLEDMRALNARLVELGAERLLISDQPDLLAAAHLPMPLPAGVPEWLSPVVAVLPGQLFGLALAEARGLSADQPTGLHKVTETW